MVKIFSTLLLTAYICSFIGCSGTSEINSERTIERSGDMPEWINTPTTEKEDFILVTGVMTNSIDRSFGMNEAYLDGLGKLISMMQIRVEAEAVDSRGGNNSIQDGIGRFAKVATGWISDTRNIAGIKNPSSYWEKVEKKTATGVTYFYHCYSLLSISRIDYNKALESAYNHMKNKAIEENNKAAKETAERLLQQLKK